MPAVFSPGFIRDPQRTYDWMRTDAPQFAEPYSGMVLLTRYEDCRAALTSDAMSAAEGQRDRSKTAGVPDNMLNTDGDDHTRLRRPAMALLGPRAVEALTPAFANAAESVLDAAAGGPAQVTVDIAEPFATRVLAALFDIDAADAAAIDALDGHLRATAVSLNPMLDPATARKGQEAMSAFMGHAGDLLAAADAQTPLGALRDSGMPTQDVLGVMQLCVVGGWSPLAETATSATTLALVDSGVKATCLGGNTAGVVEDVLRWHTPIPFVSRTAVEDVELPSGTIPAGTKVLIMIGAANRDSAQFEAPEDVQADRGQGHVAFGAGPHFCLGAALVRAALPTLVDCMLRRYPGAVTPAKGIVWEPGLIPRRVASVPLVLGQRSEG